MSEGSMARGMDWNVLMAGMGSDNNPLGEGAEAMQQMIVIMLMVSVIPRITRE